MAMILSVYTTDAFKECILPPINNSDYEIVLNKNVFGLPEDLKLKLEVIGNSWKFRSSENYRITKNDVLYENQRIEAQDMYQVVVKGDSRISVVVTERSKVFVPYTKYDLSGKTQIQVGKSEENDIRYTFREFVSKKHARFVKKAEGWTLEDTSVNGVYVNGIRVQGSQMLKYGDYINIVGLHLVYLGTLLAVDTEHPQVTVVEGALTLWEGADQQETVAIADHTGKYLFHRSPRSVQKIETDPIEIETPPNPEKPEQMPLFMAIGPALTMAFPMLLSCAMMIMSSRNSGSSRGIYMYTGLIMAVASAAIGSFWTLQNQRFHKKRLKEKEIQRFEAYSSYLLKKTEEVKQKYEHNMEAMRQRYVSAEECVGYTAHSDKLWNRNQLHTDFLNHRLGIGDVPFQVPVKVPAERFELVEDSLKDKPQYIYDNYKMLYQVPVALDLTAHRLIGIVGGDQKRGAIEVAKLLSAQIAAANCYTEVKLAYAYDQMNSADAGQWEFAKWLPHTWSQDHQVRFVGTNKATCSDLFYELTKLFRRREEVAEKMEHQFYCPHIVLFVSDPQLLSGELLGKYAFEEKLNYGLTTILLTDDREQLPNSCQFIIENSEAFQGMYDVMAGEDERLVVQFDTLADDHLLQFARRLANIEVQETETGGEMPQSLTFFDMYHANSLNDFHVLERWKKNRIYENIRGLIGQKAGGRDCYLDVHEKYHGPHGLVAGTTGSGKSETLQTYMLSLAVNYSPDDVGYFVIDYKGGGMANLFTGLPHLIGQISNLSGNQVHRAMVSIKSENRRRQQIFNENGVNNINLYTKLYKSGEATVPVPHLFIIIDEFAELKREEPDFMRELISVAQVGRSLGVHLILATQKPSGTVDDNIWSNSKFRLCLRVQDKQDSNDMLHKPDAAYITQAGRCYLQVGNDEVYELFQSGYSGAAYVEDNGMAATDSVHLISSLGKVELRGSYVKNQQREQQLRNWLAMLEKAYQHTAVVPDDTADHRIEGMYEYLEQQGVEYPRSNYNSSRLMDFVKLYEESVQLGGNVVTQMITLAREKGVKLPQVKEKTQLEAMKDYLACLAKENGYVHNLQLWMPVLPEQLYLQEFEEFRTVAFDGSWKHTLDNRELEVVIGKLDDPHNQQQMPLLLNLSEGGHVAVCGSVGSGKSTFLQSMVYALLMKYSPEQLHVYAIDYSSKMMAAFEQAPHVGGVMYEGDDEKISKFFYMMNQILEERKNLFHGGNYSQYVKAHGVTIPAILVVIDNYSAFNEKTEELYNDFIVQLSKEGLSHGIYLALSGAGFNRSEIPTRIAENIMNVFAIQQTDKFGYSDILRSMKFDVLPETGVKGRGLAYYGTQILEFQTVLALQGADDYQRLEQIEKVCGNMRECYKGRRARQIPQIPQKPIWQEFAELEETEILAAKPDQLPIGYNSVNASVYALDLRQIYCFLIMGMHRSGKKNCMRAAIEAALLKQARVCVIDSPAGGLMAYQHREGVDYLQSEREIFNYFEALIPVLTERKKIRQSMLEQDCDEDEIHARMIQEIPYFIFLPDLVWFTQMLQMSELQMEGALKNIIGKGAMHNVYFFGVLSVEDRSQVNGMELFQAFSGYRTGIHFGGKVDENRVLGFDYVPFREQAVLMKAGVGMLPDTLVDADAAKVIVPLVRGKKND